MSHFYTPSLSFFTWCSGAYIIGIISAHMCSSFYCILPTLFFTIICIGYLFSFQWLSLFILLASSYFGGAHYRFSLLQWNAQQAKLLSKPIDCVGIITYRGCASNGKTTHLVVRITNASMQPLVNQSLALYIGGNTAHLLPGMYIGLANIHFARPCPSFSTFLMKEGIIGIAHVKRTALYVLPSFYPSFFYMHYKIRYNLLQWAKKLCSPEMYVFFASLFLGYKKGEEHTSYKNVPSAFKYWGISHYIARSGLHLGVLIYLWNVLFSFVPIGWRMRHIFSVGGGLFYLLCSWSSISFLRAFITFLISKLFAYSKYPLLSLHTLALTATGMLLYNPIFLFFLDFQLSFGMTLALSWIRMIENAKTFDRTLAK